MVALFVSIFDDYFNGAIGWRGSFGVDMENKPTPYARARARARAGRRAVFIIRTVRGFRERISYLKIVRARRSRRAPRRCRCT